MTKTETWRRDPAAPVHVRCRGHVRGSTLRGPFELLARLAHSVRLDHYTKALAFERALAAFDPARLAYDARTAPLDGRADVPREEIELWADVGTVTLDPEAHAVLVELIDAAGERGAFGNAACPRLAGLECVEFAPVLRDLAVPVDGPLAAPEPPPLPEPPPRAPEPRAGPLARLWARLRRRPPARPLLGVGA